MSREDGNVLGLSTPEKYHCAVINYRQSHGTMIIELLDSSSPDKSNWQYLYLSLLSVRYYEGPLAWHGAGVSLGTRSERRDCYLKATHHQNSEQVVIDELLDEYGLLKIKDSDVDVKILAHRNFEITTENPYEAWMDYVISSGAENHSNQYVP